MPKPILIGFTVLWFAAAPIYSPLLAQSDEAATRQYAVAVGFQKKKLYDLAIDEWQTFIKKYPRDSRQPRARHYLGTCYLQGEKFSDAIKTLSEVQRLYPKFDLLDATALNLGVSYYRQAQETKQRQLYQLAAREFLRLAQQFPKSEHLPRAYFYAGESLYHQDDTANAIKAYELLVRNHPGDPLVADAYYALGVAYESLKQSSKAADAYETFVTKFSNHRLVDEVQMRQAELLFEDAEFAEAAVLFEKVAAKKNFKLADLAMVRQARCLYEEREYRKAGDLYWNVPRVFPKTTHYDAAVLAGGKCFYLVGLYKHARTGLELVAKRKVPEAAEAAHWLARSWLKEDNPQNALSVLEKAIARHRSTAQLPQLLLARADSLNMLPARRAEAVRLYAQIAKEHPDDPSAAQALYMSALAALEVGDNDTAARNAALFLQRFSDHELRPDVLFIQAEGQLLQSNLDSAVGLYQQLISQFSKHPSAQQAPVRLALAYQLQKKYAQAISTLQPMLSRLNEPAVRAEALYLLGYSHLQQKNYDRAVRFLRESTQLQSGWSGADRAALALAMSYRRLDRGNEATAQLKTMISAFPKSTYLDEAYYRLGEYAQEDGRFAEAIDYYQRVLENWPKSSFGSFALYGVGWARFSQGQFDEAVAAMTLLVKRYPKATVVKRGLYVRAMANQQLGKFETATSDIEQFLAAGPNQADELDARYVLGLCQAGLKQHRQAIDTFNRILRSDPNYSGADKVCYELAWALTDAGRDDDARAAFARLAANYSNSPLASEALFRIAESHYGSGEYDAAADSYNKALGKSQDPAISEKSSHKLGWCYLKQKQFDKAISAFERQLKQHNNGALAADASFLIGECLFKQEQWKEAEPWLKRIAAQPDHQYCALAMYRLGQCSGSLEQWRESEKFYRDLLQKFPKFEQRPEAKYGLGWAVHNLGNLQAAIRLYEEVTEETATETAAQARFMIGECYFAQKNHREALKNFLKAALGYGHEKWAALGHFEAARCFEVLKDLPRAIDSYQSILKEYPNSPQAAEAKQRLAALEKR